VFNASTGSVEPRSAVFLDAVFYSCSVSVSDDRYEVRD